LLAGETDSHFRSNRALALMNEGKAGSIFVTGGYGGFDNKTPRLYDGGTISRNYLLSQGAPEKKLYLDNRSFETLGNFAYPAANRMKSTYGLEVVENPDLKLVNNIALVTDEAHMGRALVYAKKALSAHVKIHSVVSRGPKEQSFTTRKYNNALLRRLEGIPDHEPELLVDFLMREHPFHSKGWFEKPVSQRKLELILRCMQWNGYDI
jgi:vancomycin permeability regulator SanA